MPYNPYAPGGPLRRTSTGRLLRALPSTVDTTSEPKPVGTPAWEVGASSRGTKYTTNGDYEYVIVKRDTSKPNALFTVYPCGPRGGVIGDALGHGQDTLDAMSAAGFDVRGTL